MYFEPDYCTKLLLYLKSDLWKHTIFYIIIRLLCTRTCVVENVPDKCIVITVFYYEMYYDLSINKHEQSFSVFLLEADTCEEEVTPAVIYWEKLTDNYLSSGRFKFFVDHLSYCGQGSIEKKKKLNSTTLIFYKPLWTQVVTDQWI